MNHIIFSLLMLISSVAIADKAMDIAIEKNADHSVVTYTYPSEATNRVGFVVRSNMYRADEVAVLTRAKHNWQTADYTVCTTSTKVSVIADGNTVVADSFGWDIDEHETNISFEQFNQIANAEQASYVICGKEVAFSDEDRAAWSFIVGVVSK